MFDLNFLAIGAVVIAALFLGGCAIYDYAKSNKAVTKIAVQAATTTFLDGDKEKAQGTIDVVENAKIYLNAKKKVRVGYIEEEVRGQINWGSLNESETMIVDNLINLIRNEVEDRVDDKVLEGESKVAVETIFNWVLEVAKKEVS